MTELASGSQVTHDTGPQESLGPVRVHEETERVSIMAESTAEGLKIMTNGKSRTKSGLATPSEPGAWDPDQQQAVAVETDQSRVQPGAR